MKHLDPKAVWLFFIGNIFAYSVFTIFLSFWGIFALVSLNEALTINISLYSYLYLLWFIVPIFFAFCFIWAKLSYKYYLYEITENGFRKESGIIFKRYVTIPYNKIQNVDIYRGLFARLLGLSDLHIQTAGSSANTLMSEGRLPGVSYQTAEKLRDELVRLSLKHG